MLHFLYSLFFRLALPFVLLRLWWQGRQSPETWQHWQQRLGYVTPSPEPVIWVHAVSVGETIAAAPLVKELLRRSPAVPILMTAMTATGSERAKAMFGDQVQYGFSPYDTPGSVKRFVNRVNPKALVIMETELWPNMIAVTRSRDVPIFLINARLSSRSARGYQRVSSLVQPLLESISWIAAQADEDARRFLTIGARAETVSVTGSIKFDVSIIPSLRAEATSLRTELGGTSRPIWIAASTHIGEDEQILDAHQTLLARHPTALLIIVPRHPDRFTEVADLVASRGLSLGTRSLGEAGSMAQVYLGDTMGELLMLYGVSDVAFVGGSLIERGGHNPLEPAAWGIPVLSGPNIFNFETIYAQLKAGNGLFITDTQEELSERLIALLADLETARAVGAQALAVVDANRGALEKVVSGIMART